MNESTEDENGLDFQRYFLILQNNLLKILGTTLIFTVTAMIYVHFLTPIYNTSVSISLHTQEETNVEAVLPGTFLQRTEKNDRFQSSTLILKSREFISRVTDKLDIQKEFFIQKDFKKIEVEKFTDIKIDIKYHDANLYSNFFEIRSINKNEFLLKVDNIKYSQIHQYGDEIVNNYFTLKILKIDGKDLFKNSMESKVYDYLYLKDLKNYFKPYLTQKVYFFKTNSKSMQEDIVISNMVVLALSNDILKITYNDSLPKRAKKIADEIGKNFIAYSLESKTRELEETLLFLNRQLDDTKSKLTKRSKVLQRYQEKNTNYLSMGSGGNTVQVIEEKEDLLKNVNLQIIAVQNFLKSNSLNTLGLVNTGVDTDSLKGLIINFQKNDQERRAFLLQEEDIFKSVTLNTQLSTLITELKEKEFSVQDLLLSFTDEHPQVIQAVQSLDLLKHRIYQSIQTNVRKLEEDNRIIKSTIKNNISMMKSNLYSKQQLLKSDIKAKKGLLRTLPVKKLTSQDLERNYALSETAYNFLLQKKIEVEMSKVSMIASSKIIKNPELPKFPIKPNKKNIIFIGLLIGLLLGIIYVLLKDFFVSTIRSLEDIEKLTDIPVYGTLPLSNNMRFFKEALRHIRTNLQFVLSKDIKCTKILVSSTVAGEGKTTITAGLGEVLAQANKKVLLIDLDLRKPRLHQELKQHNKIGISNFLSNKIGNEKLLIKVNENLDFISSGVIPPNPSELLMNNRLKKLISSLERRYDYILFDTSPIGSVTDATLLLEHSDIVLFAIKANESEKNYLNHLNKIIQDKNIKSAGIIFNGLKLYARKGYGYGYGSGYGAGYDYDYGVEKGK